MIGHPVEQVHNFAIHSKLNRTARSYRSLALFCLLTQLAIGILFMLFVLASFSCLAHPLPRLTRLLYV